jgi:hypothetical protein
MEILFYTIILTLNKVVEFKSTGFIVCTAVGQLLLVGYMLLRKKTQNIPALSFLIYIVAICIILIIGWFPHVYIKSLLAIGGFNLLALGAVLSYHRWYKPLNYTFWSCGISTICVCLVVDTCQDCLISSTLDGPYSHSIFYHAIEVSGVEIEPCMRR